MEFARYRKKKNYKEIWLKIFLKAGMVFFLAFSILQIFKIVYGFEELRGLKVLECFSEYYEFEPNNVFSTEAHNRFDSYTAEKILENEAKVYTEHLSAWAKVPGVELLRLELYEFYKQEKLKVFSYKTPGAYEMNWDDFSLPLSKGRMFEENADEVICVAGDKYKIGDVVEIKDNKGNLFKAEVVGICEEPYLPHNGLPIRSGIDNALRGPLGGGDIFLLNPKSVHNEKTDFISYSATLIRTADETFVSKIKEYGTCIPVEYNLIAAKPNFAMPAATMIVGILLFGTMLGVAIALRYEKGSVACVIVAGLVACLIGSCIYVAMLFKCILAFLLCGGIIGIFLYVMKRMEKREKELKSEIVFLEQKEDEVWE